MMTVKVNVMMTSMTKVIMPREKEMMTIKVKTIMTATINLTDVQQLLQTLTVGQNQCRYWTRDLIFLHKLAETKLFEVIEAGGDLSSHKKRGKMKYQTTF